MGSPDQPAGPPGPKIDTFVCRIPFGLGFTDSLTYRIDLPGNYIGSADAEHFGPNLYVNIHTFNAPLTDDMFWPANMPLAVQHFYDEDIGPAAEGHPLHEQWISLETPDALASHENPSDSAFAFHRCLGALNIFLQALALARGDDRLRPVSAKELRPIVIIGALTTDRQWHLISEMLMLPDGKEQPHEQLTVEMHEERLKAALFSLMTGQPFIPSRQWRARAERRRYEGDAADSVISFQIAAETLLYATWRMLLVDAGLAEVEIAEQTGMDLPFKSLLVRELPSKLGGSWDVTRLASPVGIYWTDLYKRRNQILHSGYQPHDGDSEGAQRAFLLLERFVEEQLWRNHRRYPRTLLAKVGREELKKRKWMTSWMTAFVRQTDEESGRFFLPRDVAGR
jgi:hypothetical protein